MEILSQILDRKLQGSQNRSYSQRALAKRLGISSGALSEILRGKRRVSPKLSLRIADKLQLGPRERKQLGLPAAASPNLDFQLTADQFHLIADWWNFAILNLTQAKGFRSDPNWIAARVDLPPSKVRQSIELLLRLELLHKGPKGKLSRTHKNLASPDGVRDLAIQKSHREDLALIERSLDQVPVEQRDLTSATFTLDPAKLPELKKRLRALRDELMDEAESCEGSEVYRLALHLFPLTTSLQQTGEIHENP